MARARPAPPSSAAPTPWFLQPWVAACVLLAAGALAYHNSFGGPFIFDDEPSITDNPTIRSFARAWWPPTDSGVTVSGRPLLNLSFALNYALGGTDPAGYHAVNLLIHLAASLLLCGVIRRTLRRPALAGNFAEAAPLIALTAAALWLLHPLQTESVTYVVQRAESLCALCYLATFACFQRAAEPGPASRRWAVATVACCALGMTAKEVMVTAPVLLALYDRIFVAGSWAEVWRQRGRLHGALAATWLLLLALVLSTGGRGGTAGFGTEVTPYAYALTQFKAIAHYLRLIVWPDPLVLDYGKAVVSGIAEVALPAMLVLPLALGSLVAALRGRPAGFAGFFFFAVLAPTSTVVPVATQTMAEHRLYLPLAGIAALAATSAYRWFGARGLVALSMLAAAYAGLTIARNRDYVSAIGIYEDTLAKVPGNARARALLADYYVRAGRVEEAREQLERSLATEPGVPEVLNNLGNVWSRLGDAAKAAEYFRQALAKRPKDPTIRNNLGNALIYSGHLEDGLAELREAIGLDPASLDARFNLANTLAQAGRPAEAAAEFAELVRRHPDDADGRNRYGDLLLAQGRPQEAIPHLEAAARLQSGNADYLNQLGIALARAGRLREALVNFEAALAVAPNHPTAAHNAALARQRLGGG